MNLMKFIPNSTLRVSAEAWSIQGQLQYCEKINIGTEVVNSALHFKTQFIKIRFIQFTLDEFLFVKAYLCALWKTSASCRHLLFVPGTDVGTTFLLIPSAKSLERNPQLH